jgi:hypothetical protein
VRRRASGDARPSRDPELQSDAALGAVVTRVWLPAPRCPAHGGLASGPGKAEQVRPRGPRAAARPAAAGRPGGGTRADGGRCLCWFKFKSLRL